MGMPAQDAGGAGFCNRAAEGVIYRLRLCGAGNGDNQRGLGRGKLRDGQGDCLPGHLLQGREAAVVNLLGPANLVHIRNFNPGGIMEIRNARIVKRQMPIFSDPLEDHVGGIRFKQGGISCTFGCGVVRLPIDIMD